MTQVRNVDLFLLHHIFQESKPVSNLQYGLVQTCKKNSCLPASNGCALGRDVRRAFGCHAHICVRGRGLLIIAVAKGAERGVASIVMVKWI